MIVFARHGQTAVNREGLLQGRSAAPLTSLGEEQAARVAAVLVGEQPTEVRSSPLPRARQTAEVVAERAGLDVVVDERLIELDYGQWEGRSIADMSAGDWERWRTQADFSPPGGESLLDVGRRVDGLCQELAASGDVIVAVSHVSPIKAAVAWALGVGGEVTWRMRLDLASLTRVDRGRGRPVLVSFNEIGHLVGDDPLPRR